MLITKARKMHVYTIYTDYSASSYPHLTFWLKPQKFLANIKLVYIVRSQGVDTSYWFVYGREFRIKNCETNGRESLYLVKLTSGAGKKHSFKSNHVRSVMGLAS